MVYQAEMETGGRVRQAFRLVLTLIGVAALIVGTFQSWVVFRTGDKLTLRALVETNFGNRSDIIKTVGGLSILIALVALLGLVDRTGWLTRLAGAVAVIVFVMFAIEAFRYYGNSFDSAVHDIRAGAWLLLGGGLVLLLAGLFSSATVKTVPGPVEKEHVEKEHVEKERYDEEAPTVIRQPTE